MASVVAVLLAIAHRDRTGEGQEVWTSLLNAALYAAGETHLTQSGASNPMPMNKSQTGLSATYRLYETIDGWLQVAAVKEEMWPAFANVLGQADLVSDARFATADARYENRLELEALLEPVFKTLTALQWRRRFDAAGVPSEMSVKTYDGESVLFDEENLRLGVVSEMEHPTAGKLRQVGQLMRFSDTPSVVQRPPFVRGQHTREIADWLGYSESEIEGLLERGIIATG
jgi:crotonobetainyl-CoA:carnitine CoA-transferase CaiB-like acyl-CoA transferase